MNSIYTYVRNQLLYRYENAKYFSIKLIVDTSIESIPLFKKLFSKYSTSQLLYTYYCVTLINNMFYNNKFTPTNYRKFICRFGKYDFVSSDQIPFTTDSEYLHLNNDTSCLQDIKNLSLRSTKKLLLLYTKLTLISVLIRLYNKQPLYLGKSVLSVFKSTLYIVLLPITYRLIVCNSHKLNGYNNIITSQAALTIGSLSFQIEDDSRKKVINKFLTSLYINDVIANIGLTNTRVWNCIFAISILYSLKMRTPIKTALTLLL